MSSDEKYPWVTCVECGVQDQAAYTSPTKEKMVERSLCFMCLFWTEKVESSKSNTFVYKGHHYTIGDEDTKGTRGNYGRRYMVAFFDGRHVLTRNLWHQGAIPDHFRDRLPNTAVMEEA